MYFLFLDNFLKSEVPATIINVFLHSLWQGAVLCVLAWACLKLTKKWSSQARYYLVVFFLFTFAATIIYTLFSQLSGTRESLTTSFSNSAPATASVSEDQPLLQLIMQWFHENANWIFVVWCFAFLFKANQMVRNLMAIERLKQFGTHKVTSKWSERFDELRASLGIKRNVVLSESPVISQPIVLGVLKPLVLVPIGFLNGLSSKEVEAILLHELAHVRRNDYLVNLIQTVLEAIFFFNPFVYWLSALIRNEREHCCDAIAIQHSGSKKIFVDALLSMQQRAQPLSYGLGILCMKSQLVNRVNRIISQKNKTVSTMEKLIVSGSYVLLFVFLASFSFLNNKNNATSFQPKPAASVRDTIPKNASKEFIAGFNAGKNYKLGTSPSADSTRKKIEERAARVTTTTIRQADKFDPATFITIALEKKRLEQALITEKKSNE